MTSCTPVSPRARSDRRNAVQNGAVFAVADRDAEHLAVAVRGHAGGDHDGLGHDPAADAALDVGGVENT